MPEQKHEVDSQRSCRESQKKQPSRLNCRSVFLLARAASTQGLKDSHKQLEV